MLRLMSGVGSIAICGCTDPKHWRLSECGEPWFPQPMIPKSFTIRFAYVRIGLLRLSISVTCYTRGSSLRLPHTRSIHGYALPTVESAACTQHWLCTKSTLCSNQFSSKYPINCQDRRSALAWSLLLNNSKVKTEVVQITNIKSCKQVAVGASPAMAVHQIRPHPAIMHSLSTRFRMRTSFYDDSFFVCAY